MIAAASTVPQTTFHEPERVTADVTVIVASYYRHEMLAIALRSIQASAGVAAEHGIRTRILVVDDASPEEKTAEVCRGLGVDYLRKPVNEGGNNPSSARVLGLSATDTPFYTFFDDDDVMTPRFLLAHVQAMHDGVDVVHSGYLLADSDLRPTRRVLPSRVELGDMLHNHNPVSDHALVRRSAIDGVWRPELEKAMMFRGWMEMAYRGSRFVRLDEPTYLSRRHGGTMTDQLDPQSETLRRRVVATYRKRVLERDRRLPQPSLRIRARELAGSQGRVVLRGVRALTRLST